MTPEERLELLIEAERTQAPTRAGAERGFERLQQALGAQVPPIDIGPVDPTLLAGSGAAGKLVALPWAAKVTAIVGVVASTGVLVGHQLGSVNPPSPPAALASVSPVSVVPPRAKAAALSRLPEAEAAVAPPSIPRASAPARAIPVQAMPAPGATASVSRDGGQQSQPAPDAREPSVKAFEDVPPKQATPAPAFDAELVLIKRAKTEFDAGRDPVARAWLSEPARRFPVGVFAAEREALIVLSTCRANPSAGAAGALGFLQRYPQSPLAERIRRSCGLEP